LDLERHNVFLAASFPSGERAEEVQPFDPLAIADAVSALARAVFVAEGRLVFGGHPTVSPLVLQIAGELDHKEVVDIYQSGWFGDRIPSETMRLVELGFGTIHWTDRRDTLDASLSDMRKHMFEESHPIGGVFIGGMSGLFEEFELFKQYLPGVLCVPLARPGGAALRLASDSRNVESELQQQVFSAAYPAVCRAVLELMARRST
jgi:hypothetical protein